ncbi:hypothetical protein YC2023_009270 [Brassica napus]
MSKYAGFHDSWVHSRWLCQSLPDLIAGSDLIKLNGFRRFGGVLKILEDVCCISVSSEEDIIFEKEISVEIGHGSVLMKNPPSFAREEVTKTSSLSSV